MAKDPGSLACIFGGLELFDHEFERTRNIRVGGINEVEVIGLVPEITVHGNDT